MTTPRMITPAYAVHEGNHRYLQDVDLTASISAIGMRDIDKIIAWSEGKKPLVSEISQSLPRSVRETALKGQLYLPEFTTHLKAFLDTVPTQEDMRNLQSHLRELDRVLWKAENLQRLLDKVRSAHFETNINLHSVYFDVDHEEGYRDLDSLIKDLATTFADEFDGKMEPPLDSANDSAWERELNDFLRRKAPPFVFGCKKLRWDGVSEQDVRSLHKTWGTITSVNIGSMLDRLLERHHDEAIDHLDDIRQLEEIIFRWQEAEGQGASFDLSGKLAEWNARQKIVSYYPDEGVILPLFPEVTHEEAVAWCEQKLAVTRDRLKALDEGWSVPDHERAPAPGA